MHTYMNLHNPQIANSNGQQPWEKKLQVTIIQRNVK